MSSEKEHEEPQKHGEPQGDLAAAENVSSDTVGRELRGLPARDADKETAERVRRAAVDAFVEGHALRGRPLRAVVVRTARALPPLIVVGTVGIYLAWAISTANALFGGH